MRTNNNVKLNKNLGTRAIQSPFLFFAKYSCLFIGRKEELKMRDFLVKLVKFFIILAILGPVISIIMIGIGMGALLF